MVNTRRNKKSNNRGMMGGAGFFNSIKRAFSEASSPAIANPEEAAKLNARVSNVASDWQTSLSEIPGKLGRATTRGMQAANIGIESGAKSIGSTLGAAGRGIQGAYSVGYPTANSNKYPSNMEIISRWAAGRKNGISSTDRNLFEKLLKSDVNNSSNSPPLNGTINNNYLRIKRGKKILKNYTAANTFNKAKNAWPKSQAAENAIKSPYLKEKFRGMRISARSTTKNAPWRSEEGAAWQEWNPKMNLTANPAANKAAANAVAAGLAAEAAQQAAQQASAEAASAQVNAAAVAAAAAAAQNSSAILNPSSYTTNLNTEIAKRAAANAAQEAYEAALTAKQTACDACDAAQEALAAANGKRSSSRRNRRNRRGNNRRSRKSRKNRR